MAIPGIPYERRLLIMADPRDKALQDYRKKLLEHKEIDGRLKECECIFLNIQSYAWTCMCLSQSRGPWPSPATELRG